MAAWDAETTGPLRRQVLQMLAVRAAHVAILVLLGAVPAIMLLILEMALGFHALILLASAVAVIGIFSLYWVGTYRT